MIVAYSLKHAFKDRIFLTDRVIEALGCAVSESSEGIDVSSVPARFLRALVVREDSVAAVALHRIGYDTERLRKPSRKSGGSDPVPSIDLESLERVPSWRFGEILTAAGTEARRAGHRFLTTGHVLLSIVSESIEIANEVFAGTELQLEDLRAAVAQVIWNGPTSE